MERNIKIIFFDIGNVLLKTFHEQLIELIFLRHNHENLPREQFDRDMKGILDNSFHGLISLELMWEQIKSLTNLCDEHIHEIQDSIIVNRNEELIQRVQKLSQQHYRIGIISDLSQIGYDVVMKNYQDLLKVCEAGLIYTSVQSGVSKLKNGEAWFADILKNIDVPPEQTLFIDDSKYNIKCARNVGMNAIQYLKQHEDDFWESSNQLLFEKLEISGIC